MIVRHQSYHKRETPRDRGARRDETAPFLAAAGPLGNLRRAIAARAATRRRGTTARGRIIQGSTVDERSQATAARPSMGGVR